MEHQSTSSSHEQHDQDMSQERPTHHPRPDEGVRVEDHLTPGVHAEADSSAEVKPQPGNPQVEQGIREHGDAFRAYLELPDIDLSRADLLHTFHEFYIGTFDSMDALLDELTEIRDYQTALNELAASWGFDEMASLDSAKVERVARETWDIVQINGRFHVFTK